MEGFRKFFESSLLLEEIGEVPDVVTLPSGNRDPYLSALPGWVEPSMVNLKGIPAGKYRTEVWGNSLNINLIPENPQVAQVYVQRLQQRGYRKITSIEKFVAGAYHWNIVKDTIPEMRKAPAPQKRGWLSRMFSRQPA
jgi:hypothetical protein